MTRRGCNDRASDRRVPLHQVQAENATTVGISEIRLVPVRLHDISIGCGAGCQH